MRIQSGMVHAHDFSHSPQALIPRSKFNRSHGHKTTFNAGYLIPVLVDEALPGDTFSLKMTAFARLATPIYPIMDNMYLESFFFAVPYRLVWDNWQRFNGEQDDPGDSTDYEVPIMSTTAVTGFAANTLYDYLGIPTEVPGLPFSSLHARAYNLIWNQWFRDENLQNSVVVDRDDGPDSPSDYVLLRRGKRYDYFTSALPWTQKSDSGPVTIPLGTSAPVNLISGSVWPSNAVIAVKNADGTPSISATGFHTNASGQVLDNSNNGIVWNPNGTLYADLSTATAATINELRQAFQIQKLYERDARGGTRYTEIIRSHFGVISPDARLQRAEYLGGGSSPINITPVAQTSGTGISDQDTPQGNLSAFGTVSAINHGFVKSFTEHCLILGLVCVRSDLTYQQGLERMWSRSTRWDFYWPALSHIGEQAILNKEIYAVGTGGVTDNDVFGYQERFAEYRYKPSRISGEFRSNFAQSLDAWHLSQDFGALPTLSDSFIVENPPMARIKAIDSEPDFIFDSLFLYNCARPMPVYGVPGLIDHF